MHTPARPRAKAVLLSLLILGCGLAACRGDDDGGGGVAKDDTTPAAGGANVVIPQPLAYAAFPVDSNTINGWIAAVDTVSIRQHAWELWAGLTAMTDQVYLGDTLPVYETWLSRFEVYGNLAGVNRQTIGTQGRTLDRGFHSPVQFHHPGSLAGAGGGSGSAEQDEQVVAGVKYNMASAYHVWNHNYTDSARLTALNDSFPAAPVAARNIVPFPDSAIATKPVYWIVADSGLTVMPYWNGPAASTDPATPTPSTWTQFVAVDPTNSMGDTTVTVQGPGGASYQAQVIHLSQFYSFALGQDEVNDIITVDTATGSTPLDLEIANDSIAVLINGQQSNQQVAVGDMGVLVAMHVSTKEIGNWAWQTFWWIPNAQSNPLATDKPASVQGPFRNFAMQQAYYMTVPSGPTAGQNQVAFNPYLETAFTNSGIVSNCMSCHRTATWPGTNYVFYGNVDPGNPSIFGGQLKLDFLWSIQAGASTAQTALLRRIRSASQAQPPAAPGGTAPPAGTSPPPAPSGR
jgi:hypothetical protein